MATMMECIERYRSGRKMGPTYAEHQSKCLRKKGGTRPAARIIAKAKPVKRKRGAKRSKDPCASQCTTVVQKRVDNGDRTPRAAMKASCLRKCHEKGPAAAAHSGAAASAPAVVKRDVKALCNRYCGGKPEKAGCERQCNDGQIGPGRLAAKLVEQKAGAPASLMNRLLKHKMKAEQKAKGAMRRAARTVKQAARQGTWRAVESARKTIGRRPR